MLKWSVQTQASMHPFFQSRHQQHPPLRSNTDAQHDCDQQTGNPVVKGEEVNRSSEVVGDERTNFARLHGDQQFITTKSDFDEVDPNYDRRKRRRTGSPEGGLVHVEQASPKSERADKQPHEQPHTLVGDSTQQSTQTNSLDTGNDDHQNTPLTFTTPRRSKRISSTSVSPNSTNEAVVGQLNNKSPSEGRATTELRQAPRRGSTPNNLVHLTANGTLKISPKVSVQSSESKEPPTKKPRKLNVKGGRIVSSLTVTLSYRNFKSEGDAFGHRIARILDGEERLPTKPGHNAADEKHSSRLEHAKKVTHPFFLGKANVLTRNDSSHSVQTVVSTSDDVDGRKPKVEAAKPWNEIKFGSLKPAYAKDASLTSVIWPPLQYQHVTPVEALTKVSTSTPMDSKSSKQKWDLCKVTRDEDVLEQYRIKLRDSRSTEAGVKVPDKLIMSGLDLLDLLDDNAGPHGGTVAEHPALMRLSERIENTRSSFDQGSYTGPLDWAHQYAPKCVAEVLQPRASALHEWMEKLKVHHVQAKLAEAKRAAQKYTKKRSRAKKKQQDELDDFIAYSDEEDASGNAPVKNAIVICGPNGCGKTASVYAAAHELGFEIFEIHPGMRRTAKDIFDRVGDMTENHLVQPVGPASRASSTFGEEGESTNVDAEIVSGRQGMMASFLGTKAKKKLLPAIRSGTPQSERDRSQKQSLILFEEVDVLFEEDRSFWAGVQSLIQQSKRPIVLTCNDLSAVPLDELQLHAILEYTSPPAPVVIPYLRLIAAAEGHQISFGAVQELYLSHGFDFRASLMQLSFWCQMTVGSKLGGLDWMRLTQGGSAALPDSRDNRTISKDTFHDGLNLIPEADLDHENLLNFAQAHLGLEVCDWELFHDRDVSLGAADSHTLLQSLDESASFADARSCIDICDASVAPLFSTCLDRAIPGRSPTSRADLLDTILKTRSNASLSMATIMAALEGITDDTRTFPLPTGRIAPSLDSCVQSVAVEVAPYVRAIVSFDLRLEEQRSQLAGGSQGKKSRTTRAARAALEGGSKEHTRRERWFPKELDFDGVLRTGNEWPTAHEEDGAGALMLESLESSPRSEGVE